MGISRNDGALWVTPADRVGVGMLALPRPRRSYRARVTNAAELTAEGLWEEISRLGVPALFHTGQTGVGAGLPGQAGYKNKYAKPYPYFDDLAAFAGAMATPLGMEMSRIMGEMAPASKLYVVDAQEIAA